MNPPSFIKNFSPLGLLDKNKPGTPETRAAERINAPYRAQGQGSSMLTQPNKQF